MPVLTGDFKDLAALGQASTKPLKQRPRTAPALLEVILLQIIAYQIAVRRDCDLDQPRNLAKRATVE